MNRAAGTPVTSEPSPVIVVGAGPTGLVLALLLAQQGIAVTVLEADTAPVEEPRAISVDDQALRVLDGLGLRDPVMADALPATCWRFLDRAGRVVLTTRPSMASTGFPRRTNIHQPLLVRVLAEAAEAEALVDVRWGHRVDKLKRTGNGVTTTVLTNEGRRESLRTPWLVGCDGARSTVRREVGIEMTGSTDPRSWLVIDIMDQQTQSTVTDIYCDPDQPRVRIPGPAGHLRWEFLVGGEDPDDARVEQLLAEFAGLINPNIVSQRTYTFHARCATHWRVGRVLLAGDAAHLNPPFGGQGLVSGLRDAANLAWKLARVAQQHSPPSLLDSYQAEREGSIRESIRFSTQMGRMIMPSSRMLGGVQANALRIAGRIPYLGDALRDLRVRPSARTLPSNENGSSDADQLPQPVVMDTTGRVDRLDAWLGQGFALVGDGAVTRPSLERLGQALHRLEPTTVIVTSGASSRTPGAIDHELYRLDRRPLVGEGRVALVRPDRFVTASAHFTQTSGIEQTARSLTNVDEHIHQEFHT